MEDKDINLMPEDLRHKEEKVIAKAKPAKHLPDFTNPEKVDTSQKDKKELSGSKPVKPSFFTKVSKIFAKKSKPDKNVDMIPKPDKKPEPLIIKKVEEQPLVNFPPTHLPKIPVTEKQHKQQNFPPIKNTAKEVAPDTKDKFHNPEKVIRARFIEDGLGVNLVPASSQLKNWQQISTVIMVAFISAIGIIAIFYFSLLIMNKKLHNDQAATIKQVAAIEAQLLEFEEINREINQTGQEINLVYDVLNKHIYWTNFFKLLEKYTTEDVHYRAFVAGNNGAITLDAMATDYAAVARQLKILQQEAAKEFVTEVDISGASLVGDQGVSFSVTLVLNPDLFYYQE